MNEAIQLRRLGHEEDAILKELAVRNLSYDKAKDGKEIKRILGWVMANVQPEHV